MRPTEVLLLKIQRRRPRLPMSPSDILKVKFREEIPIQLRNSVSAKGQKSADTTCLQEMAVMFACMKKADFKEVKCAEEINTFNKCYSQHVEEKKLKKKRELSGEMITGRNARNLTTSQLNQLLKKYPQYNEKLE